MKKKSVILMCVVLCFAIVACMTAENTDYITILNSTDYKKQVVVIPKLLETSKFEELFPPEIYDISEADNIYDSILTKYLIALMETDEDALLRENVVEILRSFRNHNNIPSTIAIINSVYDAKLEIIIPEVISAYEEIEEERFWARYILGSHIWALLYDYDDVAAERMDYELELLLENILIVLDYEREINEGIISFEDVPQEYRYEVKRLIERRHEGGSLTPEFTW